MYLKQHVLQSPLWTPEIELGIEELDQQHKKLFDITHKMYELVQDKRKTKFACVEGLKYLKNYAITHCNLEEKYMASIGYSGYEAHKRLHANFKNHILPANERILEEKNYSKTSVEHFLGSCVGWLYTHTAVEDLAIVGKSVSNFNTHFNGDLTMFLIGQMTNVTKQLANLDLTLVNMHYTGEILDKPVHYHIVYADSKGRQWFVQTSIDAKLVKFLVTKLFKFPTLRLDTMMMAALKQVVRQMIYHIGISYKDIDNFYVTEEMVLNDREVTCGFMEHSPKYSLLFGSKEGFFSLCADVWDDAAKQRREYCKVLVS